MSLHIEITDEARTELERMQKKSLVSSIVVSVLTFVLITLIFIAAKIIIADKVEADVVVYTPEVGGGEDPESEEIPVQETQTTPPTSIISAVGVQTNVNVPQVEIAVDRPTAITPTVNIATVSMGGGKAGSALPPSVVQRCTLEDRLQRIQASGGSPKFEESVVKGLRWLMKTQDKDGSWKKGPYPAAMTGLALLAYLAHCETPYSEEFGESCQNAIAYLVSLGQKNNGIISTSPKGKDICYEHAVATYALAEANMFCNQIGLEIPGLKDVVEKAGNVIIQSQATDGGWMYYYRTKTGDGVHLDLSVTGWNVQALKAISHSGVKNDAERALRRAEIFTKKMGNPKTGEFQYSPGAWRASMAPVGVLSLQMMGAGHSKEAREGIKYIEKTIKPEFWSPYVYYYAAQVLINRGGEPWANFGKKMGEALVSYQNATGDWPVHNAELIKKVNMPATINHYVGSANAQHYETCLNILTLEVYYRFLPATGEGTRNVTGDN